MSSDPTRAPSGDRLRGRKHGYHSREHDLRATNKRLFSEAKDDSPFRGWVIDEYGLVTELERHYELRGWDRDTGLPTEATLWHLCIMDDLLGLVPYKASLGGQISSGLQPYDKNIRFSRWP